MPNPPKAFQPRGPEEIQRLLEVARQQAHRKRFQLAVRTRRLSVISVNCWGREIYHDLEIPFQTPFVNLYVPMLHFLGILENFNEAMRAPLEFIDGSSTHGRLPFPIGRLLGEYELHFMHFKSVEEARDKWYRRRERIAPNLDDCYFMMKHLSEPYVDDLQRFERLPFRNKVLFLDHPMPELPNAVVVPARPGALEPDDAPTLYRRCQNYFNIPAWLNKEESTRQIG